MKSDQMAFAIAAFAFCVAVCVLVFVVFFQPTCGG